MIGGDDISWQALGRIVHEWTGDPAELTEVIPLSGGSVNNTLLLVTGDDRRAVLKITPHRVNRDLQTEAFQLQLLKSLGLPVPAVICSHLATLENPNSYLLMEYVEGITLAAARKQLAADCYESLQRQLADLAVRLHHNTRDGYGKVDASGNHVTSDWPAFYRSLHESAAVSARHLNQLPLKIRKKLEKLHERLDQFIVHHDQPRLCHGDLWSANILCREVEGQWRVVAIIDPNLRYGHAESELAYLDLFETCSHTFKKTYQQSHKLTDDYHRIRKPIYQLYPLMNSVQMHGAKYVGPLMKVAERATAVV